MDAYEPMKEIPEVSRVPEKSKGIAYRFLIQLTFLCHLKEYDKINMVFFLTCLSHQSKVVKLAYFLHFVDPGTTFRSEKFSPNP